MHHAVVTRSDLDERADREDADDLAVVQRADLGNEADVVDHLLGSVARCTVDRSDEDVAVVVDVDLCAGIGADLLDGLAAGADDLADLVDGDDHGDHLGRVLGDLGTRLCDAGQHDLLEDLKARLAAALERIGDDFHRQALVLEVHLDRGNALGGTGNLEVHLAVEVLNALNVGEGSPLAGLLIGDQAAGDACDRALDGNARVHQRQRRAADGALRGRAVGGQDLGDDADGVRELLHARNDGQERLFRQRAVADLTTGGRTGGTGLAGGEGREIVVVDIALGLLGVDGVQLLRGGQGVQRADGEHLRLASGEQAGAVDSGQDADLGVERTNLVHLAAVDALAGEQPLLDDLLLHLVQTDLDMHVEVLVLVGKLLCEIAAGSGQALLADVLVVGIQRVFDLIHAIGAQIVEQLMVDGSLLEGELRLADDGDDLVDELDDLHIGLVRLTDALEDDHLGSFLRLRLDLHDLLKGGGHADEALGSVALLGGGVDHVLTADKGAVRGGDRSVPGNVGTGDGNGRADRADDFHGVFVVIGKDGAGHDHVVAQLVVKERAHRAVDDTAVEDAALGGLALAAVEAAGDPADGVHSLLKLDGQGEVVDAGLGIGGARHGGQDGGVAVAADALGVRQFCDLAGLHGKGATADHGLKYVMVGVLFSGDHFLTSCKVCFSREV